jgi:uncharacterized membrane protein YhaH (DUF805 family)
MMNNIDLKYLFMTPEGRIGRQQWWIGVGILFAVSIVSSMLFGQEGIIPFVIGILMLDCRHHAAHQALP